MPVDHLEQKLGVIEQKALSKLIDDELLEQHSAILKIFFNELIALSKN